MRPCIHFIGRTQRAGDNRVSEWPKKVFASITHILIGSKFDELFYLRFRNLRVSPECVRGDFVNICITSPFMDIREVSG
jgi:hypothetical protein